MKKFITTMMLVLIVIASMAQARTKTPTAVVLTGQSTLSTPMKFSATTDYVSNDDTLYIDVIAKQYVTCVQRVSVSLTKISGAPNVTIQLQGKVFVGDTYANIGSAGTYTADTDNPVVVTYTTANTYRYFRVSLIGNSTVQHSHMLAFEFQDTHTSGGTNLTGINIGTNQAIWGTTGMTVGNGAQTVAVNSSDWDISATGVMTGIGAITTNGLVTGTAGADISGAVINLNPSSNFATNIGTGTTNAAVSIGGGSNTVAVNSSAWDISTAGAVTGVTTLTTSGLITATGGLTLATTPSMLWAAGGSTVTAASGTDVAFSAGARYWVEVNIPYNKTITGAGVLLGSVGGTDSLVIQLCNSAGVQVATTRHGLTGKTANLAGTTATFQDIDFVTPYAAVAGRYFIVLQTTGTTAKFRAYAISGLKCIANTAAGTWGTKADITPGTTFVADKGPISILY